MIRCIAIDDEPLAVDIIRTFCSRVDYLDLVKTFNSAAEASDYIDKFPVELIFLDIHMPVCSGIDFIKEQKDPKIIIFTTAYSEYAVNGFELNATDYLIKPFSFERFIQAVEKAKNISEINLNNNLNNDRYLAVRSAYKLARISFSDILYIQALDNYIRIVNKNNKSVMSRITLKEIIEKLPKNTFIRIHRSFILNTEHSEISYSNGKIIIKEIEIPVGNSYEKAVRVMFGISQI